MEATLSETARLLGTKKQTLFTLIKNGVVSPGRQVGGVVLFDVEHVREELTKYGYFERSQQYKAAVERNERRRERCGVS